MSTHTDGASSPSVRDSGRPAAPHGPTGSGVPPTSPTPPAPRPPSPRPRNTAEPADGPDTGPVPPQHGRPPPAGDGDGNDEADWLQLEIQRRIQARGVSESGRHSRSDRARTAPGDDTTDQPADDLPADDRQADDRGGPPTPTPVPRAVGERTTALRRRSTRVPDPYAPDGMREPGEDAGPPRPEPAFRMPGPAAANGGPPRPPRAAGTTTPVAPAKQWPPENGPAGLPRRVPGAGWSVDRQALLGESGGDPPPSAAPDTDTRLVPTMWKATRSGVDDSGPPTADFGRNGLAPHVEGLHEDDLDEDDLDEDDLDEDDLEGTGLVTGDTEIIWRAPGLDASPPPVPVPSAPAAVDGSPAPYTGVRPRRFAGPPTDVEQEPDEDATRECPALDEPPRGRRKRIVLSERRTVTQSVRTVVDVQDPGPVGDLLRTQLVNTQLGIALRVGGFALLGLGLLPALFAAFPSIGDISVLGFRVPWLVLGFLTYPFLMLLGWWFVGSAERVEQDFVQEVQER